MTFKTSPLSHHSVRTGSTSHPDPSPFQVFEYTPNVQLQRIPQPSCEWAWVKYWLERKSTTACSSSTRVRPQHSHSHRPGGKCEESFSLPIPKIILGIPSRTPVLDIRNDNGAARWTKAIQREMQWLLVAISDTQETQQRKSKKNILSPPMLFSWNLIFKGFLMPAFSHTSLQSTIIKPGSWGWATT